MKHIVRTITLLLFAASINTAQAQWNLEGVEVDRTKWVDYTPQWNPDPQLLIPGAGCSAYQRQGSQPSQAGTVNRARRLQDSGSDALPDHWNNAETIYFPPVFNQSGGSCGVSSRVGYMLTEELNAYRGTNATLDENRLSHNFEYPFSYNGTPKEQMAYYVGYPDMVTYGGFPYSNIYGFYEVGSNNAGWMQGYDKWYVTMHNRINHNTEYNFPVGVISQTGSWGYGGFGEGAMAVKRWLYNHNGDNSFHTGGLCGLGVASSGATPLIPATETNTQLGVVGKYYWCTGQSVDHAVTMVGYDDRIEFDLDGNGTAGERNNSLGQDEVGAWIIVNSWGSGWANGGFIYVPYALAGPTCSYVSDGVYTADSNTGWTPETYTIRKDYTPNRTLKATVSFTQRSAISLKVGISTDLEATEPDEILTFHHFNYQGDDDRDEIDAMTPMLGQWTDGVHYEPMEFGYDLTDLGAHFDRSQSLKYFFIIESKSSATGVGGIHSASIIDYFANASGVETPFEISGDSVTILNAGGRTVISTIVQGEALNKPINLQLNNGTLTWDAPQGTPYTVVSYNVYKDGELLATTDASTRSYVIGDAAGLFTVTAVYQYRESTTESAASNSVNVGGLDYLALNSYITSIGNPISSVSELKDGMTVLLYCNGRGQYAYDNGSGNNYLARSAVPETYVPDDYKFVFVVGKRGSSYTFRSINGYLPAVSSGSNLQPSSSAGSFTIEPLRDNCFTIQSGAYLNSNPGVLVGWWEGQDSGQSWWKIIPVDTSTPSVSSLGDYTSQTAANLTDGQIVALFNNGRNYYMTDTGSGQYAGNSTSPDASANPENYLFRIGRNTDGTITLTSRSGSVPSLSKNNRFSPSDNADAFTLTDQGNGLFRLLSTSNIYLDGNNYNPVGWDAAETNGLWRFYPLNFSEDIEGQIYKDVTLYAGVPARLYVKGDKDITAYKWTVNGETYLASEPTVTFPSAGNYTATCVVTNARGKTKTLSTTLTVLAAPALSADFEFSAEETAGSDRISFLPTNLVAGCTYSWSMPGAEEETADTRNASASYSAVGEYEVTLTVTAPDGRTATTTKTVHVVAAPPKLDYQFSKAIILKGQTVTITDKSKYAPTWWRWDLVSDLNRYTSFEQNPSFSPVPGVYDLYFTASNEAGSNSTTRARALSVCSSRSYNGLNFTGNANQVSTSLKNDITTAWTIDFWLRPTSLSATGFGLTGTDGLTITSDGAGRVTVKNGSTVLAQSSTSYYVVGQWHHYAISYANGVIYFNRDGSEFSNAACSLTDFNGKFASLTIGGSKAPCTGIFDEFRVWNTALSQAKLRTYAVDPISDVAAAESNDGLELYYQFNQSGGNCTDATSNGFTGVRSNFGPDGDAWALSDGVFALSFDADDFVPVGELLDQTLYNVTDCSDAETSSESSPGSNAIDGNEDNLWHSSYSSYVNYPHWIVIERPILDEIQSIQFYIPRAEKYKPTSCNVFESEDGETWTAVMTNYKLLTGNARPGIILNTPVTKRYVKIEFPAGGSFLALNEIYFYGKHAEVAEPNDGDDVHEAMVTGDNGTLTSGKWTYTTAKDITVSASRISYNTWNNTSTKNELKIGATSTNTNVIEINANATSSGKYVITGYSFKIRNANSSYAMKVTPNGGSATTCSGTTASTVTVSGLNATSTSFTVSPSTSTSQYDYRYAIISDFTIYYADKGDKTVTYRVLSSDGSQIYAIGTQTVSQGTTVSTLPTALKRDYCTYSSFSEKITTNRTIDVRCTWSGPFTVSQENDTTYYYLKLRNKYVQLSGNVTDLNSTKLSPVTNPTDKWAFFGNPYGGFRIVCAANALYLSASTSNTTNATLSASPATYIVHKSTASGYTNAFVLQVKASNTAYINDYYSYGHVATWTGGTSCLSDAGSAVLIENPGDYASYVVSDIGPYLTTNVGSGYVGTLSEADCDALQSEYNTAAVSTTTFSEYWQLLNKMKAALIPLENGGYYRLQNAYFTDRYVYMTTDRLLYYKSGEAEALKTISSVCETQQNADGTWSLLFEGVPLYGVKTDDYAYGTDPTYTGATATPAAVNFIIRAPGEYAIYAVNEGSADHSYLHSNTKDFVQGWTESAGASQWHLVPAKTIVLTPATVTSEGTGYASLCLPFPATINENDYSERLVNYYILEAIDGEMLVTSIVADDVIPANTGVLLRRAAIAPSEDITLTIGGTPTASLTGNRFVGTNVRLEQDGTARTYVFSTRNGQTKGFYKLSTSSSIPANKAYFTDAALNMSTMVMLFFEDEDGTITALSDLPLFDDNNGNDASFVNPSSSQIYDLQGRRVTQPARGGIYIVNGRKVYIK